MELTASYWDDRYINGAIGWDIGEISTPLRTYIDQLTNLNKRILVPGAGNAYEVEYLFKKGFKQVYLLDWSAEALRNFSWRVPDFPEEQLLEANFFEHEGRYDLIIEQTFFCTLKPPKRFEYARHMHQLLKDDGQLVGLLFNAPMNHDRPPYGGNAEEYRTYFQPYFNFKYFEDCENSIGPRAGSEMFINLIKLVG